MYYLFDIYGIDMNRKKLKYFGYYLARDSEFGLILYDSKDTNKCYVPSHLFTVCMYIGSLRLIADDWMGRMVKNFKQAKKNGQIQV